MADIDTVSVILRVQEHPVLWDVSHGQYKDREARQAAWLDICEEMFQNFNEYSEQQKQTTAIKVQSRWKTARDTYNKVNVNKKKIKSGSSVGKRMKYSYYDMMTFLDANLSNRCTEEQEPVDMLTCPDENSEAGPNYSDDENLRGDREAASSSKRKRSSSPSPTLFEKQLLAAVTKKHIDDDDEDVSFFKSIMPNIKKFNSYQKLLFRAKVLAYLIEVEKEKVVTLVDLNVIKTEKNQ